VKIGGKFTFPEAVIKKRRKSKKKKEDEIKIGFSNLESFFLYKKEKQEDLEMGIMQWRI
jgi:hypothetical protein